MPGRSKMRTLAALAGCALGGWILGGCAETVGPASGQPAAGSKTAAAVGRSGGLKLPGLGGGGYATIYTIQCMETRGPEGARMVELMAKGLRNVQGLDPKLVRAETSGTVNRLYYGAYKGQARRDADQFTPPQAARDDLATIRSMASGQMQPFQLATIVEMPTPDPGPPEWDLRKAPGVYSLQITYCFDKPGLPNHKEVAVEICKSLRQEGEEAWYLHNDRVSVVTVGHFDESAIETNAQGQVVGYSPAVVALQNKREAFKYNSECGSKIVRVIGGKRTAATSVLIRIPREPTNEQPQRPGQQLPSKTNPPGNR